MIKTNIVEESRKGPWTEHEDLQLVYFVRILGERRWDFIAKVSGLKRTGKSCRLRWVNYLHPGLKRGRMTPEEERLILDLHSIWGNRWSRIARRLPGRTDNEIKNYWRTHMRKKAQERKQALSLSSSSSSCSSTSVQSDHRGEPKEEENMMDYPQGGNNSHKELKVEVIRAAESTKGGHSMNQIPKNYLSGAANSSSSSVVKSKRNKEEKSVKDHNDRDSNNDVVAITIEDHEDHQKAYSMEQIWEEIASPGEVSSGQSTHDETCQQKECNYCCSPMVSLWDYCSDTLWALDEEEIRMLTPITDPVVSYYGHNREY
ncbi:hypothetical protein Syun_031700 [Stephania yunnanensis]|uniref:Uncharacterized protein n=1 Tax=Stephania yunnanensis TaxID=152371 RepID=A0AAP0E0K2_9MAGN